MLALLGVFHANNCCKLLQSAGEQIDYKEVFSEALFTPLHQFHLVTASNCQLVCEYTFFLSKWCLPGGQSLTGVKAYLSVVLAVDFTCSKLGNTHFSLATSGCQAVTNWSLALGDWCLTFCF